MDDVDKVLDEINDQNDQLQQINTAMQTPIGDAANLDEDELARELEVSIHVPTPACLTPRRSLQTRPRKLRALAVSYTFEVRFAVWQRRRDAALFGCASPQTAIAC